MLNKDNLKPYFEKRKFQRIALPLKLKYKVVGKNGARGEAKCADISGGGVGMRLKRCLEAGDNVELTFSIPNFNKPIVAMGKVVWITKMQDEFKAGLRFTRIKFKSKFSELLCEEMINSSLITE